MLFGHFSPSIYWSHRTKQVVDVITAETVSFEFGVSGRACVSSVGPTSKFTRMGGVFGRGKRVCKSDRPFSSATESRSCVAGSEAPRPSYSTPTDIVKETLPINGNHSELHPPTQEAQDPDRDLKNLTLNGKGVCKFDRPFSTVTESRSWVAGSEVAQPSYSASADIVKGIPAINGNQSEFHPSTQETEDLDRDLQNLTLNTVSVNSGVVCRTSVAIRLKQTAATDSRSKCEFTRMRALVGRGNGVCKSDRPFSTATDSRNWVAGTEAFQSSYPASTDIVKGILAINENQSELHPSTQETQDLDRDLQNLTLNTVPVDSGLVCGTSVASRLDRTTFSLPYQSHPGVIGRPIRRFTHGSSPASPGHWPPKCGTGQVINPVGVIGDRPKQTGLPSPDYSRLRPDRIGNLWSQYDLQASIMAPLPYSWMTVPRIPESPRCSGMSRDVPTYHNHLVLPSGNFQTFQNKFDSFVDQRAEQLHMGKRKPSKPKPMQDRTVWYHCDICDCNVNSEYQFQIHVGGVKHRKRVAMLQHKYGEVRSLVVPPGAVSANPWSPISPPTQEQHVQSVNYLNYSPRANIPCGRSPSKCDSDYGSDNDSGISDNESRYG